MVGRSEQGLSSDLTCFQNPDFRHIDLDGCGPGIKRADSLKIKFWVKSGKSQDFRILLELSLNLRSLQFIGKEVCSKLAYKCIFY